MTSRDNIDADYFSRLKAADFYGKESTVDFRAIFLTREHADLVAQQYVEDRENGIELENIEIERYEEDSEEGFELTITKRMIITEDALKEFDKIMAERVSQLDGHLDGWGIRPERKPELN